MGRLRQLIIPHQGNLAATNKLNAQRAGPEEESVPRHGQKRQAFLNNAERWRGNGRTSGMRCVIARAERVMDDGFCVFSI